MTFMTREEVIRVVEDARERGDRPDLIGANLCGVDLRGIDLSRTDMYRANLYGADLSDTDLSWANLYNSDLSGTKMCGTNLHYAELNSANLRSANLFDANLRGAGLDDACLFGTNLRYACLFGTDLRYADLRYAKWHGLVIDGLHPYRILLTPTPDGWRLTIGCWSDTPDELRTLIAQDSGWPEAEGEDIIRRRPLLEAALCAVDAHITAHAGIITDLKERWEA